MPKRIDTTLSQLTTIDINSLSLSITIPNILDSQIDLDQHTTHVSKP